MQVGGEGMGGRGEGEVLIQANHTCKKPKQNNNKQKYHLFINQIDTIKSVDQSYFTIWQSFPKVLPLAQSFSVGMSVDC